MSSNQEDAMLIGRLRGMAAISDFKEGDLFSKAAARLEYLSQQKDDLQHVAIALMDMLLTALPETTESEPMGLDTQLQIRNAIEDGKRQALGGKD